MNALLNEMCKRRKGHYCHCAEVSNTYDLECIAEGVIEQESDNFDCDTIIDFLETLTVYYLGEDKEEEEKVYNFSFREYIGETLY